MVGFPFGSVGKESACNEGDLGSNPGLGRTPGEGKGLTPVFWPGEFHGLYSPWGHKELDTTERLSLFTFPGGKVDKNLPANVRDTGLIPGPEGFHVPRSN